MTMGRQKTGVPFNVEIMPRLQAAMDAMPASNHLTFQVTAKGHPFTAAGFGNWFRDMCREAKLPKRCTSHGLRKAAVTYLAEQGATDHHLMAWFGWSSISQAQVYTKAANRKRMAQSAARLISGTGIGSTSDPVSQKIQSKPLKSQGAANEVAIPAGFEPATHGVEIRYLRRRQLCSGNKKSLEGEGVANINFLFQSAECSNHTMAHSNSHGAFPRPFGCLVVSALMTDCCVSLMARRRRVIMVLSAA